MIPILMQSAALLGGVVMGPGGAPIAGAVVATGAQQVLTDAKGGFSLKVEGAVVLRISAKGFSPQEREAKPGETVLVLLEREAQGATVEVVEGSGYSSEGPSSSISRLEIYMTPGAAADVFQATKALPGVSNASEGAELFVRGGKPEEVGIYLNGGRLPRPYHHPNTQGGIFSSVDTAMVTRLDFIPGGFSAKYGDALSAVLDLSTEESSPVRTGSALINLAGQGIQQDEPVGGGVLRGSYRHASPVLLDKLYGLSPNFTDSPISDDLQLNHQTPLGTGRLTTTAIFSQDHLAVDTRIANVVGIYDNRSRTRFLTGQFTQALGERTVLSLTVSDSRFHEAWSFGPWGITQEEHDGFLRAEGAIQVNEAITIESGLDRDQLRLDPRGMVPFDLANWNSDAAPRVFAYGIDGVRTGAYATVRWLISSRWGLSIGGRSDRYGLLRESTRDARATVSYQVSEGITLRLAGGSFHQAPPLMQLDPYAGNQNLKVLRATHAVLALDARWKKVWDTQVRLEAYRKDYDHLVVEDPGARYLSDGRGYAQGLDLLLKASRGSFRGWIGYGYLDTKRREAKQAEVGPVPTSVPHNLTVVGTWSLKPGLDLGGSWRYATGAPVTPISGSLPDGNGGFEPQEGKIYSDRLPAYGRMDLRLSRLFPFHGLRCVAFAEVMNLLNRHNVSSYSYNPDYSQRRQEESYFSRRILVAGLSLAW
ncbi:MAG: TonB-dependent receptor [Holophagaceae bacterium]|nr:TonB-dependent receptor [Holophagaceae bacterium]